MLIEELIAPGATAAVKDTVVIWEQSPGTAGMRFCTAKEAEETLALAKKNGSSARMITVQDKMGIETFYGASPEVRDQVAKAIRDVQLTLDLRDSMDRNGIPKSSELRCAVYRVAMEARSLAVFEALNPGKPRSEWVSPVFPPMDAGAL